MHDCAMNVQTVTAKYSVTLSCMWPIVLILCFCLNTNVVNMYLLSGGERLGSPDEDFNITETKADA